MNTTLKQRVAEALKDERAGSDVEAVTKLRELADAIGGILGGNIDAAIEPGYRVNLGQQYNLVLRAPKIGYRDVLFRAYVPPDGFPVHLDLFGDAQTKCSSAEELEQAVVSFLAQPNVKSQLLSLKDVAA